MFSQLQLDTFRVEELAIQTNPLHPEKKDAGEYHAHVDFNLAKPEGRSALDLRVIVDVKCDDTSPEICAFDHVRIVVFGAFSFSQDATEEFIRQITPQNQLSILYGLARGIVATSTGATSSGPFLLPSVNFFEIVKRKIEKIQQLKEQQAKTMAAFEQLTETKEEKESKELV